MNNKQENLHTIDLAYNHYLMYNCEELEEKKKKKGKIDQFAYCISVI